MFYCTTGTLEKILAKSYYVLLLTTIYFAGIVLAMSWLNIIFTVPQNLSFTLMLYFTCVSGFVSVFHLACVCLKPKLLYWLFPA